MFKFIINFILGLFVGYILIIVWLQDLDKKSLNLNKLKKSKKRNTNVLFIYPHPDDELMAAGGLIQKMVKDGEFNVFVVDITKGDKGDELLKLPPKELGAIREVEFDNVMEILGVENGETWDIPDGEVPQNIDKVKTQIENFIKKNNIDLIVTYERWGVYGHQDHVSLSKVVHEISEENDDIRVLYSTISPKIAKQMNMKQYITGLDLEAFEANELPEFKLAIFTEIFTKYQAAKEYKSQNLSHKYPLWVTILMNPYEYYTTKYK